jgi:hypothetical protein
LYVIFLDLKKASYYSLDRDRTMAILEGYGVGKNLLAFIKRIWDGDTLVSGIEARSPIQWIFRHVKGHQDDIRDAILDRWALLNIEMDSLTKLHWLEKSGQRQPLNSTITGEYWPVFIRGRKLHSNLRNTLYEEIYREKMAVRWDKKDRMDTTGACGSIGRLAKRQ